MKKLIFVLLFILCFSCSKEMEPFNPVQTSEIPSSTGDNSLVVKGKVESTCFGEAYGNAAIHAHAVMNLYQNQNANNSMGEFRFQVMDQHQHQNREIVAAIQQYHIENGICWMIGQVTMDNQGCDVGGQYQNHGEYCPYRDGDCDKECDCECKCECTCDCQCGCQGDCECDCTCECCTCLQHRLRTRLRGSECQNERTRLRAMLRSRTCGCDCNCDCDCPNDGPGNGDGDGDGDGDCDCDCHQHQWQHSYCHDWCCNGECCGCDACQQWANSMQNRNRSQNGKGKGGAGQMNQYKWLAQHNMQCRVGQQICIRVCDGDQCSGSCDQIAWRWCDEKEPLQLTERMQWQLCRKNIVQGDVTIL